MVECEIKDKQLHSGVATAVEDGSGLNGRGAPARENERHIDLWRRWWNANLEKARRETERAREREDGHGRPKRG